MLIIKFISQCRPLLWNPAFFFDTKKDYDMKFYSQEGFKILSIPKEQKLNIIELKLEKNNQKVDEILELFKANSTESFLSKRIYNKTEDCTKEYIDTYYIMIEDDNGPRFFKMNRVKFNLGVMDLVEVNIKDINKEVE